MWSKRPYEQTSNCVPTQGRSSLLLSLRPDIVLWSNTRKKLSVIAPTTRHGTVVQQKEEAHCHCPYDQTSYCGPTEGRSSLSLPIRPDIVLWSNRRKKLIVIAPTTRHRTVVQQKEEAHCHCPYDQTSYCGPTEGRRSLLLPLQPDIVLWSNRRKKLIVIAPTTRHRTVIQQKEEAHCHCPYDQTSYCGPTEGRSSLSLPLRPDIVLWSNRRKKFTVTAPTTRHRIVVQQEEEAHCHGAYSTIDDQV